MKKLILIDTHAVIHRAYHALPPLSTPPSSARPQGEPINAVYGFTTILLRILRELKPDYLAAAFDLSGPTFRHVAYERYKAHRPETPSDLSGQFAKTEELLEAFGIPVFKKEGYEADDIIGTMVKKLEKKNGVEVIIVTGDMDTLQLVRPGVRVYAMKKGITDTVIYNEKAVTLRYGFRPDQLIDFKGLKGDPSDNIPGVKGIGEKTATDLIKTYGSIEGIYKQIKKDARKFPNALFVKLKEGEEDARLSRELATINCGAPIEFDLESIACRDKERAAEVKTLFQKFGFFSILKRFEQERATKAPGEQAALAIAVPERKIEVKDLAAWSDLAQAKEVGLAVVEDTLYIVVPDRKEVLRVLPSLLHPKSASSFFKDNTVVAVYDGKTVIHFLRKHKIATPKIGFDIMIASYLVSPSSRDFSYTAIITRELGRTASDNVPEELVHLLELGKILKARVALYDVESVLADIELPLTAALADMEERGILIDRKFLKNLGTRVDHEIEELVQKIYELAGAPFNINSPRQLSSVLFETLGIKTYGLRKTAKGGAISTRESELEKLKSQHPIIEHVLKYRELAKLKSTYIDVLPTLVNPKTKRVHTTFHQTGTVTGRLSSSDPNLQNIPVQSEHGREVRRAFIAEDGYDLVSFDYSQIELRVAAHMAGDEKMIEAFERGVDIHRLTAAEIYNLPLEEISAEQRRAAKTLNFGVLYGMGPQAFSEATGFSLEDAKKFIQEYFSDFSGVRDYITRTKRFAEENGYVATLLGRKRPMPEMASSNWQMKREAERMAVNMPLQGTAADIVKLAMIKIDRWVEENNFSRDACLLLQVHDELVFEIKKEKTKKIVPEIKKIMESIIKLKVPLVVDIKTGKNWGEQTSLR